MTEPPEISLPDPASSRAVLIGVSEYTGTDAVRQRLTPLPAVLNNLLDLGRVFTGPGSWNLPAANLTTLVNPNEPREITRAVKAAANACTDCLLVYYAGHGLIDGSASELHLSATVADITDLSYTTVAYKDIKRAISQGNCRRCLLILDCCYSGLAHYTMSPPVVQVEAPSRNSFVLLTATTGNALAMAPPGARYTLFTGEMLKILDEGLVTGPEFIDPGTLWNETSRALKSGQHPVPDHSVHGDAAESIALVRNRLWSPDSPPPPSPRREPPARTDGGWARLAAERLSAQQYALVKENAGRHGQHPAAAVPLLKLGYPGSDPPDALRVRVTAPSGKSADVLLTRAHWEASGQSEPQDEGATPLPEVLASLLATAWRQGADPSSVAWEPHPIGNGHPSVPALFHDRKDPYRRIRRDSTIDTYLRNGQNVLLTGESASGKTTTSTQRAETYRSNGAAARGKGLIWLDLTDPFDGDESVMLTLLTSPQRARHLLVIDNIHSHVSAANDAIRLVTTLRTELGMQIQILATTRPGVLTALAPTTPLLRALTFDGRDVVRALVGDLDTSDEDSQAIIERARGDIGMAKLVIASYLRHDREVPSREQVADDLATTLKVDEIDGDDERQLFFWFASLGSFEIDIPQYYVRSKSDTDALDALVDRKIIEPHDQAYSIGHPTRALMLFGYARRYWGGEQQESLDNPGKMIYEYLQEAGEEHIRTTLDTLKGAGRSEAVSIIDLWSRYAAVTKRIEYRFKIDPYWGGNATSAVYAAIALAAMAGRRSRETAAKLVWNSWELDDSSGIPRYLRDTAIDREFFRALDAARTPAPAPGTEPPFDAERSHAVWILGLLLRLESKKTDLESENPDTVFERLDGLLTMATEGSGRTGNGAYRPEWLPWVTANMVTGLADLFNGSHAAIRESCDWLKDSATQDGHWSGTPGSWMSDAAATALCLIAVAAEVDSAGKYDEVLRRGYNYLERWLRKTRASAGLGERAIVTAALLLRGGHRPELDQQLKDLLRLVELRLAADEASVDAVGPVSAADLSFEIPFVAAELAEPVLAKVRNGLERIIEDEVRAILGTPDTAREHSTIPPGPPAAQRPAQPEPAEPAAPAEPAEPPVPDPAPGSRTPDSSALVDPRPASPRLARQIEEGLSQIDTVATEMVKERQSVLRKVDAHTARIIQVELDRWRGRRTRHTPLAEEFHRTGTLTPASLAELNDLGEDVNPHSWHHIPAEGEP